MTRIFLLTPALIADRRGARLLALPARIHHVPVRSRPGGHNFDQIG
jgi:hypothetical protein